MDITVKDLLHQAISLLKEKNQQGMEDPSKEAGLLLSWVLKKDLGYLYAHTDYLVDNVQAEFYMSCVRRRAQHEPFAYITGECEFMGMSFFVNPSVLIPRADTELLAEAVICALGYKPFFFNQPCFHLAQKDTYRALEIGTGSGCLAVSAAKHINSLWVEAVDISEAALRTAEANAFRHGVNDRISFIQRDFLDKAAEVHPPYDIIFSNPPYIRASDIPELMPDVRDYEPHTALDGGVDGLAFYKALAQKAHELLLPHGILAVECGFDQAMIISEIFSKKGMKTLCLKDLAGIDRVVMAQKEQE